MRRMILVLLMFIVMLSTSGCWDAKDIGTLDLPFAGAYDKDGNNIIVTTISPNLSPDAKEQSRITVLPGITIGDTRNRRAELYPRTLLIGMLRVSLFGEELAKDEEAMSRVTDLFLRSPQVASYVPLAVTEGPAQKILSTPTEDFENMGNLLIDLLRVAPQNTFIPASSFHRLGKDALIKGENPVMPLLKVQDKKVVIAGSAIFKHYKLIAKLNNKETRSMVLLRGEKPKGYLAFILQKDGKMIDKGSVLVKGSRKVSVERQGDEYHFTINVTLNGTLVEHSNPASLLDQPEQLDEIDKLLEANMENECRNFIDKMQNVYGIDCINISEYALAKWRPELMNVIESKDFIKNIKIDVKFKVKIKSIGELN